MNDQPNLPGVKFDQGKSTWHLMPWGPLHSVLAALEMGVEKYGAFNWQKVDHGYTRYSNAAMRHMISHMEGEYLDQESGLPHLAHAACNCLFAMWFRDTKSDQKAVDMSRQSQWTK